MGYKCCVANCKSGYASTNSSVVTKTISFFAFPRNIELRKKLTRACHRQNFEPTEHSRICSLHFEDSDFDTLSSDAVNSRRLKRPVLKQRKLKPNVVPGIHPNLPQRMQDLKNAPRSSIVTAAARRELENESISRLNAENLSRDDCLDFTDFVAKVRAASLPSNYFKVFDEGYVIFLLLANVECGDSQPCVKASIKVTEDVSWLVDQMQEEQAENMTHDEANMVYYIAGCIGRSISRQRKCIECKTCLIDPSLDNCTRSRLLHLANRGGLAAPSEYSMTVCIYGFLHFKQIFDSPNLATQMFQKKAHAELFSSAILCSFQKNSSLCALTTFACKEGHLSFQMILRKLFNCLSKNIVTRLQKSPPVAFASDSRKLKKLKSCSTSK